MNNLPLLSESLVQEQLFLDVLQKLATLATTLSLHLP